jgi:hypothetical protein
MKIDGYNIILIIRLLFLIADVIGIIVSKSEAARTAFIISLILIIVSIFGTGSFGWM